jgi:hypothetical protein
MTYYSHLGNVIAAREEYTDEELAQIALINLSNARVGKTVLPLDDIEVNEKNVAAYAKLLTLKTL